MPFIFVQSHSSGRQCVEISYIFVSLKLRRSKEYLDLSDSHSESVNVRDVWTNAGDAGLSLSFVFFIPDFSLTCAKVIPLKLELIPAVQVD